MKSEDDEMKVSPGGDPIEEVLKKLLRWWQKWQAPPRRVPKKAK